MALRSFKFQLRERRVRIVPSTDPEGCPFSGPGVDRIGDESDALLPLLAPLLRGLEAFEPGIQVRSISVDLERLRLLATLEAPGRPRVVRMDNATTVERLLTSCTALLEALDRSAQEALARRTAIG